MHRLRFQPLYRFAGLLAIYVSLALPLSAQSTPQPQGLEDYLRLALTQNPGLDAFAQRYEAAMQRIPQASALPDPKLGINHFVESVQTRTGPQENALSLSQTLPWFGTLQQRETVASTQAEALWHAFQNQQLQLTRQVSQAYYDYAYLGKAIELTTQKTELLERLLPIVDERVRGGGSLNALLRLKVEIGKINDQRQSLENSRLAQRAQLNQMMGQPADSELPWPEWSAPTPISVDTAALLVAVRESNPELAMLQSRVDSAQASQELARLDRFPDVTLGLNYIQIGAPEINPTTPDAGQDAWGVSFAVNLPIWLNSNKAQRAETLSQRRAAEQDFSQRWNALQSEISFSIAYLKDADRRIQLYGTELLGLAEQAVEISHSSYENGQASILEVIDSERSLLDLQLLYWRAAADSWKQTITLQTLSNQALTQHLKLQNPK